MKYKKTIKIVGVLSLLVMILSISSFAYYTNTNKYFEDSGKDDGEDGLALERESNEFIIDGCGSGTMLDTVTGLCWLKNMNTFGQKNWSTALTDCSSLDYAGHSTWEIPTRNELFTLINQIGVSGSTCVTLTTFGFTNCQDNTYWSSNEYQTNTDNAWLVAFSNGGDNYFVKTNSGYVTCVVR